MTDLREKSSSSLNQEKSQSRKVDARKLFGFSSSTSGANHHTVLVDDSSSEDEQSKSKVAFSSRSLLSELKNLKTSLDGSKLNESSVCSASDQSSYSSNERPEAKRILSFSRLENDSDSNASLKGPCLPELSELDGSLICPSFVNGKVNESNVSITKTGRRKSVLGKNVVYLVSESESDSENLKENRKTKESFLSWNQNTRSKAKSKGPQKTPGRTRIRMLPDSDDSDEEQNDVRDPTSNADSPSDLEISLNEIKRKYGTYRRAKSSESPDLENESESEDGSEDDSFVVPDDEVGSSPEESLTEESDFSVSDEESESESSESELTEAECNDVSWLVPDNVVVLADISQDPGSVELTKPRRRQIITDSDKDENNSQSSCNSSYVSPNDNSESDKSGPPKSVPEKKKDPHPSSIVKSVAAKKPKTFLQSLSETSDSKNLHPSALKYISNYNKHKQELAKQLFSLFNREVFGNIFPEDMEIFWSTRLTHTAGRCHCKRRLMGRERWCRVELSTKILDSCDRLRDTLIHELCHAAVWIISEENDDKHGPIWRGWARRAMTRFPELPLIARCHTYEIRSKYIYQCIKCGYKIGRHSKSIDITKMCCGKCKGKFQLMVASKLNGQYHSSSDALKTPKAPNAFAAFVKDNYKHYRTPGSSHKDAMAMLSKKFAETKISK